MPRTIRNWGRSYAFRPRKMLYPASEEEIAMIVRDANAGGRKIRVIGSGHSWTELVPTDDILISLDRWQGLIRLDAEKGIAEVKAGTKLLRLGRILHQHGFALENLGDIDVQSIAGAFSTGTHGTGKDFGTLATQLTGLTIITGKGDIVECSETENREIFKAAQISLGALGIITRMKVRLVPAFRLEYVSTGSTLEDMLENFETYVAKNRNYEFYWFPHTALVQAKFANATDKPVQSGGVIRGFNDIVIENLGYAVLSHFSKMFSGMTRWMSRFSAKEVPKGRWIDYSHKIFATKRWVKFKEMEFNVPEANFKAAMREIVAWITANDYRVHMPLEVRYVKADDILISPAYGRNCVYIAVHQFKGMEYKPYFEAIEKIFLSHGGRPHFGKMNTLGYETFAAIHPNWQQFIGIRNVLDPNGVMLNPYLRRIFNLKT